ncbi:MAG: hypothetical protein IKY43_01855 [Bacteroidales bacterium]|nr:hypothetical protein [Bacteroidales bacterium]
MKLIYSQEWENGNGFSVFMRWKYSGILPKCVIPGYKLVYDRVWWT